MNESFPKPETERGITREEAIASYKKFVEKGITSPDDLDLEDPEVKKANDLFDKWRKQEDKRAEGNEELGHRVNLAKTMFYVEAGFTDPGYLDEVLKEWLMEDYQGTEEQKDNPERTETRRQIAEAIERIKKLLAEQNK
ncbi:MAG: hypothetical protein V1690_00535 [Candidatus Moraniibacteriota bacterium]